MNRLPIIALGLTLVLPADLSAQYAAPRGVAPGSRVRVSLPSPATESFTGRALAFSSDSLLLEASSGRARTTLRTADVARVEVSDGVDRLGTAFRYGGIGAVAGALVGVISLRDEGPATFGLAPIAGGFAGAVLGGGIGATAGAVLAPERWRTVWSR